MIGTIVGDICGAVAGAFSGVPGDSGNYDFGRGEMSPLTIGVNEQILSAPVVCMSIPIDANATHTPSLPTSSPRPSRYIWGRGLGRSGKRVKFPSQLLGA